MTTKRELERLARRAFGKRAIMLAERGTADAWSVDESVTVDCDDDNDRREMLAAALRGIIQWKEGA